MKKNHTISKFKYVTSLVVLLFVCSLFTPLFSQTIKEYTPENFNTFIDDLIAAQPNTEFVFTQVGEYQIDGFPNIDVPIVLRAAEGLPEKPVLVNIRNQNYTQMLRIRSGGTLTVKGLEFNGEYPFTAGVAWAIRTDSPVSGKYHLVVEDCVFKNFYQHAFRAASDTDADSIIFRNCIFDNIQRDAILFWEQAEKTKPLVGMLEISNCTFSNIDRSVVSFPESEGAINGIVKIDHITAYNIGNSGDAWPVLNLKKFDAISLKNSIIANASALPVFVLEENAILSHNNFYKLSDDAFSSSENCWSFHPGFENTAELNFTVNNAHLYGKSETGNLLGDIRWAKAEIPNSFYYSANQASDLQAHLTSANNGDVFILTDGGERYVLNGFPNVNAKVTIKAAAGLEKRPILNNQRDQNSTPMLRIHEGGSLVLSDIEFDGLYNETIRTSFGIRVHGGISNAYHLIVDNCYFHGFKENALRVDTKTHADSIVFNNCVFEDITGREGFRFAAFPATDPIPTFDLLKVRNSTFANIAREAIKVPVADTFVSGSVIIDQVTINNAGDSTYSMLRLLSAELVTISNSIFTNSVSKPAFQLGGSVIFDYCNTYQLSDDSVYGGSNMLAVDPMYTDASNMNFELMNAELYNAGDKGQAIGDPRWIPFMVMAQVQSATNTEGAYVKAQSNSAAGKLYIILQGELQQSTADFEVAVLQGKGAVAELTGAAVDIEISTTGLVPGTYNLYGVNNEGVISSPLLAVFSITEEVVAVSADMQKVSNAEGQVVFAKSNKESGQIFIVLQGEPQTSINNLSAAVDNKKGAMAIVQAANTSTEISTYNLVPGTYNVYAVDGQNNISSPLEGVIVITLVPVEVYVENQDVTNAVGQFVEITSNHSVGVVYLVKLGEPYGTVADLEAAVAANKGASASLTEANVPVQVDINGIEEGIYYAFAVDGDGNISEPSSNAVTVSDVTGFDQFADLDQLSIYSVNNTIIVNWNVTANRRAELTICNSSGAIIFSEQISNGTNCFQYEYKGMVLVQISDGENIVIKKFVMR